MNMVRGGLTRMSQTVLIIADDAGFARDIVARWQLERVLPNFTHMSAEVWASSSAECDLSIVGPLSAEREPVLLQLERSGAPAICVLDRNSDLVALRSEHPRILPVRMDEDWVDALVILAGEVLRRVDFMARVKRAENSASESISNARLGKFMVETLHSFNNALTSVLGNAELLMLESDSLPAQVREQVDTIHSMALRLHEMMQRFSSLESEMRFAERQSQGEISDRSQAFASGD